MRYRKLYYACALVLLVLCSMRSYIRTFDWRDEATLFEHDVKEQPDNYNLAASYTSVLLEKGETDEAVVYAEKSVAIRPTIDNLNKLGFTYQMRQDYKSAYNTYRRALALAQTGYFHDGFNLEAERLVYENIPGLLLLDHRPNEAMKFLQDISIRKYPQDAKLYMFLAIAEYDLKDQQGSLKAASFANQLKPGTISDQTIYNITHGLRVTLIIKP